MFRNHLLASFLAAAAICPLASAADSFGRVCTIEGRIEGASLVPGESLTVQVSAINGGEESGSAFVGPTGEFSVPAAPQGVSFLKVLNSRGQLIHQETMSAAACQGLVTVRVPVRKKERPASGTVSVAELARKIAPEAMKHYEKGEEARRKQDLAKAHKHLQKAVGIDPSFVKAYTALGMCYAAQDDRESAIAEYRKALAIQHDYIPARLNLAAEMWNQRRYAEAEESARLALKSDPTIDKARLVLGFSLAAQGKAEEALANLRAAASSEPQARLGIAELLARQGHNREAVAELKAFLDKGQPKNRETVEGWIARLETRIAQAR